MTMRTMSIQNTGTGLQRVPVAARRTFLLALVLIAGLAISTFVTSIQSPPAVEKQTVGLAVDFEPAVFPDESTDGVLLVEIPEGSFDAFESEHRGYVVPPLIRLKAGDKIQIDNHDTGAHMIFYSFVFAGSSASMLFDTPGAYVYSSGCAVDPRMNTFTTIIVSA